MKIYMALIVALGIFLGGATVGTAAPPTLIHGDVFVGDYLRIGINNMGTLGVTDETSTVPRDPGVGFQWAGDDPFKGSPLPPPDDPIIPTSTESLAIWWWGEGYNIAYKELKNNKWVDNKSYWQPSLSLDPNRNITLVSSKVLFDDETQKAVKEVVVRTNNSKLELKFTFTFLRQYPELNLETTITNIGNQPLRDIVYKRIVDWDVCTDVNNTWASTSQEAFAWGPCIALDAKTIQLTVEGNKGVFRNGWLGIWVDDPVDITIPIFDTPLPIVNYIDLYAWDDMTIRSPAEVTQSFEPLIRKATGDPKEPFGDFNAGIYYKIDDLNPGKSKTVYTVYQSNFPPKILPPPVIPPEQP